MQGSLEAGTKSAPECIKKTMIMAALIYNRNYTMDVTQACYAEGTYLSIFMVCPPIVKIEEFSWNHYYVGTAHTCGNNYL